MQKSTVLLKLIFQKNVPPPYWKNISYLCNVCTKSGKKYNKIADIFVETKIDKNRKIDSVMELDKEYFFYVFLCVAILFKFSSSRMCVYVFFLTLCSQISKDSFPVKNCARSQYFSREDTVEDTKLIKRHYFTLIKPEIQP